MSTTSRPVYIRNTMRTVFYGKSVRSKWPQNMTVSDASLAPEFPLIRQQPPHRYRLCSAVQVQEVAVLFEKFKVSFNSSGQNTDQCLEYLAQLKMALLDFTSLPPSVPSSLTTVQQQELLLARDILEHGSLLSVKLMDIPAFERYVAQLKVYYTDCAAILPESQKQYPILGLNLLRLLAQNRIAEFHTELELIPSTLQQSNMYIKFPAQLEQHIMEGSYNKVLSAKQDGFYSQEGMYFMDMLVDTVREEIAECSEKAYSSIAANDLQSLLMLSSLAELNEYAENVRWASRCSIGP